MGYIAVTPEDLQTQSSQVAAGSQQVSDIVSGLMSQVSDLASRWQGSGSAAFQQLFDEWQQGALMTKQGMDGIAQFLSQASAAYAETDQKVQTAAQG